MLALPARIAGCREVILCTPCGRDGRIAPEILYAADLCGVDRVFALGGAQAVAAMAYGTESIPRVDKIFGPGNRYVTKAKQLAGAADVAVDLPAGPSEVLVLAAVVFLVWRLCFHHRRGRYGGRRRGGGYRPYRG